MTEYPNQNQQSDAPDPSDKYDAHVLDENDILSDRDLQINPTQYIHLALQRSQIALLNPNLEAGITQYIFLVQQIELLCFSAGLINQDEYKTAIELFKSTNDYYKNEKRPLYSHMLLSQEKLRLLLTEVFSNRTSSAPLKL